MFAAGNAINVPKDQFYLRTSNIYSNAYKTAANAVDGYKTAVRLVGAVPE